MLVNLNHEEDNYIFFRKKLIWILGAVVLFTGLIVIDQKPAVAADVIVYKSPSCGCCKQWAKHMRENGFNVEEKNINNLIPIKQQMGIPGNLQSCHTAKVGDYVIEGHVPASDIKRLLAEKPNVAGLTVPAMPMGSPGMEGPRKDPYNVLTIEHNGKGNVFSSHNQR